MKKSVKTIVSLLICIAVCCCSSAFAMDPRNEDGDCGSSKNCVKYFMKINDENHTMELAIKTGTAVTEDIATRTMNDFGTLGDTCDARWGKLIDPTEPENSCFITKLIIDEGVKVIGENAFRGQIQLQTVDLASSVTEIKDSAFENAVISKLNYYGTEEQWENMTVGTNNGIFSRDYSELVEAGTVVDTYKLLGDVDLDGEADITDTKTIADFIVGNVEGKTIKVSAADVNNDGEIDVCDCVKLLLLLQQ